MEIEAKYAVVGPLDPAMLNQLDVSPYQLRWLGRQQQHDTLLDTAGRAITRARYGLRLRRAGEQLLLTLKGPGTVMGSLHQREEHEVLLPAGATQEHWPRQIADRVAALVGAAALQPLLETEILRRTWLVERHGQLIAELVLDEGRIMAAGRQDSVHELELELAGQGQLADLQQLGQLLLERLPLQPEQRTKLQRGLALLEPLDAERR